MAVQEDFINCLKKHGIISNENETKSWFKQGGTVTFRLPNHITNRPTNVKYVSVRIECNYVELGKKKELFSDNLDYKFRIIFSGIDEKSTIYQCSWHLDYEPRSKDKNSDEPKVSHPLFHLTYGGKTMRDLYGHLDGGFEHVKTSAIYTGENCSFIPLLLIAPRIPFPPMDYYLGIDFVICNFWYKKDYQKLQSDPKYKTAIRESQKRLWEPYYTIMANNWNKNSNSTITSYMLNQMLI